MDFKDANELYAQGLKDGIRKFAWWKDGIQYVGTCGMTLKEAIEQIEKDFKKEENKENI